MRLRWELLTKVLLVDFLDNSAVPNITLTCCTLISRECSLINDVSHSAKQGWVWGHLYLYEKCIGCNASLHASLGSVLGPLLFVMHTSPLNNTLISSLTLNRHLYADDTQLFSPFVLATLTQVSPTSRPLCNRYPPVR